MTENLEIDCKDCNATFKIKHNLNLARYEIGFCSFCGSEDIDMEDEYDEEETEKEAEKDEEDEKDKIKEKN